MDERELVLNFVRYGGDPSLVGHVPEENRVPFLPALALLTSNSPSLDPPSTLLPGSHILAPSATAYASLDFTSILRDSLQLLRAEHSTQPDDEPIPDESFCFLSSGHEIRARIMLVSLLKGTINCSEKFHNLSGEDWQNHKMNPKSIWNSKPCLADLSCVLPIAVFRCPEFLLPETLIHGLLPTRWGFVLLSITLLNNPLLLRESVFYLSVFIQKYEDSIYSSYSEKLEIPSSYPNKPVQQDVLKHHGPHHLALVHSVKQAMLTLLQLSKISKSLACLCRDMLIRNRTCASIAVFITAEYIDLAGCLLETCKIVDTYNYLQGSFVCVRKALLTAARISKEKFGWSGQLHGHLRVYCMLIWAADLKPLPEEVDFWLNSLSNIEGSFSKQTLQLGFSFLCLVPVSKNAKCSRSFSECVKKLLKCDIATEAKYTTEVGELSLWFAVQLFLRQFQEIVRVITEVMGTQMVIQNALIMELHNAAVAEVLSEPSVLLQIISDVRLKGPLSSKVKHGHYFLQCVDQLLRSGHFSRCGVDVSEAVQNIISVSVPPIDDLLVKVIQAYAEDFFTATQDSAGSLTFRMPSLPHSFLEDTLLRISMPNSMLERGGVSYYKNMPKSDIAKGVIASYYMLCRDRLLRTNGLPWFESSTVSIFRPSDCIDNQWASLFLKIPFYELFQYMEEKLLDFKHILPQWLSLAAALFPERFSTCDLLGSLRRYGWADGHVDIKSATLDDQVLRFEPTVNIENTKKAADEALLKPMVMLQFLDDLDRVPTEKKIIKELVDCQVFLIKELVPKLLNPSCHECLQEKFCIWFNNLDAILRPLLLPTFIETILDTSCESEIDLKGTTLMAKLKRTVSELDMGMLGVHNTLVQQPMILLACKRELYQTSLLSVVLFLLQEYRTLNRRAFLEIVLQSSETEENIKSEEVESALLAQDSAMCHVLLEVCSSNGEISEPRQLKAHELIFGYLAPLLEANYDLLRLVHLQVIIRWFWIIPWDVLIMVLMINNTKFPLYLPIHFC
ncbi:hypothetical protein KP509_29G082600 [Ceratopteris richardii]|uniref:Uncharacterized protein n=1 Tax=Ceratopteris richardii TaxID=49495 RepID=A0A8T2RAC6_CERRI|nr:hypothetical protein KP509_29G082600 [Ceratopteris richardii]